MGFGAIYLSIVLFVGAWGAGNMRHHVKVENMRIKEAELKELKSMERMGLRPRPKRKFATVYPKI